MFEISDGHTYLAYTEYDRERQRGTVAFMKAESVARFRTEEQSNHMAMYHYLNGYLLSDIHSRDKILTGTDILIRCKHFGAVLYHIGFLPPATKLGQGNIFRSVCQEFCPQGVCMAERGRAQKRGMHGRGHVW